MLRHFACVALLALLASASGCVSYAGARTPQADVVRIVLKENDFKTIKTHLTGSADCTYLFGAIALGDPNIVSKAELQVREGAAADGRAIQLVNWTKDETITNLLILKTHAITFTADAIEFTKN